MREVAVRDELALRMLAAASPRPAGRASPPRRRRPSSASCRRAPAGARTAAGSAWASGDLADERERAVPRRAPGRIRLVERNRPLIDPPPERLEEPPREPVRAFARGSRRRAPRSAAAACGRRAPDGVSLPPAIALRNTVPIATATRLEATYGRVVHVVIERSGVAAEALAPHERDRVDLEQHRRGRPGGRTPRDRRRECRRPARRRSAPSPDACAAGG